MSVNTFSFDEDKGCITGNFCCLHLPVDYNPVKFKSPDYVLTIDARSHAVYVTWYFDTPKFQVCPNPGFLFMGYSYNYGIPLLLYFADTIFPNFFLLFILYDYVDF